MVTIKQHIKQLLKLTPALLLLGCLSCTSTLQVKGDFPRPVIHQLPLQVAVHYQDDFRRYRYVEKSEKRSKWEISIGNAQVALFDTVLPAMFENVVQVSDISPQENTDIDLFFEPYVEEFQYNMPRETKVNMFEVWIKYNMKVYDGQGLLIADWILTAYGKTPTAFMKSEENALNEAMIIALRDVGAGLSLKFSHIPEINSWLNKHGQLQ
ncbi:hypothetical protein [Thalassomonas actiniarum]|uniref:ABC-type transport auxiliary lipoprotein component domain-containing protein n=1 Tax=Thalassomonas actiniarum TaxID=485447 RepID=A0AAF0C535_9GAMM|nr:hypothetical protein [Thalassomonas actiniarum]WDE00450.1 hypothetical protein SG35_007365 [Thalassomonas actiniarum]